MDTLTNPNFFGDETINRVSFLRTDKTYISTTVLFPATNFIFYTKQKNNLIPLINTPTATDAAPTPLMKTFKALPPHFQKLLGQWAQANESASAEILDLGFTVVFLGIDETETVTHSEKYNYKDKYVGTPIYAVYLNDELLTSLAFVDFEPMADMTDYFKVSNTDVSLISYGKMYLDWLHKYNFCPGCGTKMIPVDAGTKLFCLSDEAVQCSVKTATVNNVCFPRTDPVVITCITNTTRDKVLLGMGKRHRFRKMYSCIAGFMEPSETIEKATIREIWEETGCHAKELKILCSQPWPFPVNLMIGCVAIVEFNGHDEIIDLDHDKELADARWFDIDVIARLLKGEKHPEGIYIPMKEAIAYRLIQAVVNGEV